MRLRRFVVAEDSMLPTLLPGDFVLALRGPAIRPGDVVVVEHPRRPGFWLVKRVSHVADGVISVISDNQTQPAIDSASFGEVPVGGAYRVVWRYWPLRRS